MPSLPIRVLFVCLGNICRSPMAEAVLRHKLARLGLSEKVEVDSAGTGNWHVGAPPHDGTMRTLQRKEIEYEHCGRQIARADLDAFDYIVTMDSQNLRDVKRMGDTTARVATLLSYAPQLGMEDVPDPWYTGKFEETYELVDTATNGLLADIRKRYRL